MSRPVDLGLVGCGRLAEAGYLPAVAAATGVRIVAVTDPDRPRRDLIAGLASGDGNVVMAYAELADLLASSTVDGLVLASPAEAHVAGARAAVQAGIPVLVEKPPAPSSEGAAELARLVPPPWVGFNRRFDPGVQALSALVPERGHVRLNIEIHYRRLSWRPLAVHDDAVVDLGPHAVDLARWLTGSEILDVTGADLRPEGAEFHLGLERARAHVSLATDRPHRELFEVFDHRDALVGRHRLGGLPAAVRGRVRRAPGPPALVTSLAGQLDAFAAAIRGEASPVLGTATDGLAVMDVIDALRRSAARGGRHTPLTRTEL